MRKTTKTTFIVGEDGKLRREHPYLTDADAWFLIPPHSADCTCHTCKPDLDNCLLCNLTKRLNTIETEATAIREALYQLDHTNK